MNKPDLIVLRGLFMIFQTDRFPETNDWSEAENFYSVTRSDDEISVICRQKEFQNKQVLNIALNRKIIKVKGPLELTMTGIISGITSILALTEIPVFTVSTYNTDFILIEEEYLENAVASLQKYGYCIVFE